jgi:O-antigen ligase
MNLLKTLIIGVTILDLGGLIKFFGVSNSKPFSLPSVIVMNPIWFGNVSAISLYASLVNFFLLGRGNRIWASCLIINALGIFLSNSRGPYLATLIVFGVVFLPIFFKEKLKIVLPLLMIIIFGTVWFTPEFKQKIFAIDDQIKSFFSSSEVKTSIGARLGMWRLSFEMFKDNPLLGVGTGDYELEIMRRTEGSWSFLRKYNQPHSIYFYFLALYGSVGLGILGFLFFLWFKESLKMIKEFGITRGFGILASAVGLHYLIAGVSETLFKIHILAFFFGIMAGVCFFRGRGDF